MEKTRVIFHIDMDAFFASIEQRDNPDYKGKPVIVGAKPGQRGVVSAASYEARRFGVRSAMPVSEAYKRCPHGVFVTPRMERYSSVSKEVMSILYHFSPSLEQVSVDEAFLDMSGSQRLFGSPLEAAQKISHSIKETENLTASIGIAPNKFLAKIASDMKKPDGITLTPFEPEQIIEWLSSLPVGRIWGVGKKTGEAFHKMGIMTIGDLQKLSLNYLSETFGKPGTSLYYLSRGIDRRPVQKGEAAKSISREYTFETDSKSKEHWKKILLTLSQDVAYRARKSGVKGSTIVLTYRLPDFTRHSRQTALPFPCDVSRTIYEYGVKLLDSVGIHTLRLIGIGITDFKRDHQLDLFFGEHQIQRMQSAERALDKLAEKFGKGSVSRGTEIGLPDW